MRGMSAKRLLLITIPITLLLVAGAVALVLVTQVFSAEEECDWAEEVIPAIEDGSLQDGSFESSEACNEQFREDLEDAAN